MINDLLDVYYLQKRKPGQKAIIFFSTIKMCTMFADYLKSKYPDIDTRRYVGEDDYDEELKYGMYLNKEIINYYIVIILIIILVI